MSCIAPYATSPTRPTHSGGAVVTAWAGRGTPHWSSSNWPRTPRDSGLDNRVVKQTVEVIQRERKRLPSAYKNIPALPKVPPRRPNDPLLKEWRMYREMKVGVELRGEAHGRVRMRPNSAQPALGSDGAREPDFGGHRKNELERPPWRP